ncbi:hypothetical protein [Paenibacillus brasilensis]|uniref:DUF4375 domain-containing protein n=1 Tax=Paenibacillus brasilensis TaxID=128574 RepID=A0ABU0KXM5_9BACL|nr:hypothetical protein [Paenibacillus brasilensis]MDQ0494039.1 hypothetical protein [Paenibacillus brasilensis]
MGLDITAYRKLVKVENPKFDADGELEDYENQWQTDGSMRWSESCWPGRAEGVEFDTVYTYDESYGFRAGSYSGYNLWRKMLSDFAEANAFQELIEFSDCEGVIGPVVSAKLANDFTDYEERARKYADTFERGEWWIEKYQEWKEAFRLAADGGAVNFR